MHHHPHRRPQRGEQAIYGRRVANIQFLVTVLRQGAFQVPAVGQGGSLRAKEAGAHVIVNPHHLQAFLMESLAGFRTDQSGGAGDNSRTHILDLTARHIALPGDLANHRLIRQGWV